MYGPVLKTTQLGYLRMRKITSALKGAQLY